MPSALVTWCSSFLLWFSVGFFASHYRRTLTHSQTHRHTGRHTPLFTGCHTFSKSPARCLKEPWCMSARTKAHNHSDIYTAYKSGKCWVMMDEKLSQMCFMGSRLEHLTGSSYWNPACSLHKLLLHAVNTCRQRLLFWVIGGFTEKKCC